MNKAARAAANFFAPDDDDATSSGEGLTSNDSFSRNFLVSTDLSDEENRKAVEKYRSHIKSMLCCGEGEAIVELGVSIDDDTQKGLSKEELQIAEERHKQLMKQSNISSSHLVTKRCGDLYTSFHLIRDNVDADDFIETETRIVNWQRCGLNKHSRVISELALVEDTFRLVHEADARDANTTQTIVYGTPFLMVVLLAFSKYPRIFQVRVAVVGNVDAGKSTLLGVLTHSALDDGRGQARRKLFRRFQLAEGEVDGFDDFQISLLAVLLSSYCYPVDESKDFKINPESQRFDQSVDSMAVGPNIGSIVTVAFDLYISRASLLFYKIGDDFQLSVLFRHKHEFESGRTSSVGNDILGFSMDGQIVNKPDVHSGNLDWVSICRDSAKVITFIDLAGHEKYLKTTIFGMTGHAPDYTMLMVGSNAGIIGMTKEHLSLALSLSVPVFVVVTKIDMCPDQVLAETLRNLDRLMKSPGVRKLPLPMRSMDDVVQAALHFAGGRCTIALNDTMMIGPNASGEFVPIPIKSIHRKRMPVSKIRCGQTASFAIRKFNKKEVRKGMVLVSPLLKPRASLQFDAEVLVLHHPTTIARNYQAMVHVASIRQTATIIQMTKEVLRTGDRDLVTFRFIRNPEYIRVGSRMVFREGRTKAVGTVTKVYPHMPAGATKQNRSKHAKQKVLYVSIIGAFTFRWAPFKANLREYREGAQCQRSLNRYISAEFLLCNTSLDLTVVVFAAFRCSF
uniref:Tr-type G domain-containing protein n=1 Tax=Ascaris lumbricoides TaxID=6252 RepID=A0A9J2NZW3_ASCLU